MTATTATTATTVTPSAAPAGAPRLPLVGRLWHKAVILGWIVVGCFLLDRLALVLMDYWLLESLGFDSVFWTNFKSGALLFALGLASSIFVIGPALAYDVGGRVKRIVIHLGLLWGVMSGYLLSKQYLSFLMAGGEKFGELDPVFGNDIGMYVFDLPPFWIAWRFLYTGTWLALASWVFCAWRAGRDKEPREGSTNLGHFIGVVSTRGTRVTLVILGVLAAVGWWYARYGVLTMSNKARSVTVGASHVDVTGIFSTVNDYMLAAVLTLAAAGILFVLLGRLHRNLTAGAERLPVRKLGYALLIMLAADFAFKAGVALRQSVAVGPNEPVVQLPYIERHIEATRKAFNLGDVETVRLVPKNVGDPLPDVDQLLASPTLKNAPLWPGFVSYLEDLVDPQHKDRIFKTDGDPMIYGPVLENFQQQQKLRAYYRFLDVDTIRYPVDGETHMMVSAAREVPLREPQPWLAWWGQQFMLFTHGYGLVTASAGEVGPSGDPVFVASGIPVTSSVPGLQPENQRIYYGEGAGSMAYSNVKDVQELDYPTDEGRQTMKLPADVRAGVKMDSLLKRLVFGWKSGQLSEILFSGLIEDDTRVHYFREPLERLQHVAPFLYYDGDPICVPADGRLQWIVNGITFTDKYPYAEYQDLGDKSDRRSIESMPHEVVNYVKDGVKATVDSYTGQVVLYAWEDDPILRTLRSIYPALFKERAEMPAEVRSQVQYPVQLMHVQFDDLYILYQMKDVMTFFNMEDMWDDGDEVLGPILDEGKAIRFSIEPFYVIADTADTASGYPKATPAQQFAMAMAFTPEQALNLRAIPMVYMDGEDYGRIVCFQVPKGHYFLGPEQADALIDQDPEITQKITWWSRRGVEVIRGHTTALLIQNEVIYVEPVFLRSRQNPVPQLKQVAVVFRGKAVMAPTLEEALREVVDRHKTDGPTGG